MSIATVTCAVLCQASEEGEKHSDEVCDEAPTPEERRHMMDLIRGLREGTLKTLMQQTFEVRICPAL